MMRVETMGLAVPPRASVFMEAREDDDVAKAEEEERCSATSSSSSSSSIGRNSDVSSERSMDDNDNGENEAESAYNGPLHAMETLEQVLPIRRGISKFYNGKSKSFTSLADAASTPSMKDIAKPENAYTRRRRNLMAFNHAWDKSRSSLLRNNSGGISKRTISTSRSYLALAVAMNNSESSSSITSEDSTSSSSNSSPEQLLPPLHPRNRALASGAAAPSSPLQRNFSAWRSFSLADLHHCAIAATVKISSPSLGDETAHPS